MSTTYRERKKLIAHLCVYGFIREQYSFFSEEDFPDDISNLCLLMYFILKDEWSLEHSFEGVQIDEANIISLSDHIPHHTFHQALGMMTITKGNIHTWQFQTLTEVMIGITDVKAYETNKGFNWSFKHLDDACGLDTDDGNKYGKGEPYADSCCNNEVISMTLDMTGDKYATLSFKIDDKDYGVAMHDIDLSKEYRMIIDLYSDDQVKLLQ